MQIDIEWSGKSYSSQIDNLDAAFAAALAKWRETKDHNEAECAFAEMAFAGWRDEPDGWTLIIED